MGSTENDTIIAMNNADIITNDIIIGKLSSVADAISKTVISAYNDKVAHATNVSKMSASKFNLAALERCAEFLNVKIVDSAGNALFSNKNALANRIILAIKALFPSHCDDCQAAYHNEFDSEEPIPFKCFVCFRGSHNCSQITDKAVNAENLTTGHVWICNKCKLTFNPVKPPKKVRNMK